MFKSMKTKLVAVAGSTLAVAGSAMAAVPAAVTTALNDAGTDAAVIGGAVLVVIIGIAAFKYMRKAA
ncbi:major capsid protein [Pseudogulbenkiania sp. MAI-1]|uniref:major capsid protein n=1 Tax=Pseudogulbenkiania sp. MAI-1 TaxID=990370 RepID=UPI00045EA49F|nr:major capsid protein [Pseudogulbenkiania sp. MAI-1]